MIETGLNESDIEQLISRAVKDGIEQYRKEETQKRESNKYHDTFRLMKCYRDAVFHKDNAISEAEQLKLKDMTEEQKNTYLQSIRRTRFKTVLMLSHIDKAVEEIKRRRQAQGRQIEYEAFEAYFMQGKDYAEIAEELETGKNMSSNKEQESEHNEDRIYSNNIMTEMVNTMTSTVQRNNLEAFRKYIEKDDDRIKNLASDIQYSYSLPLYIYDTDTKDKVTRLNPSTVMENMYGMSVSEGGMMSAGMQNTSVWTQLLNNQDLLDEQYDMVAGNWPQNYNEVVIVVNNDNEIDDYTLYSLGFKNPDEVKKIFQSAMSGDSYETEETSYSYDEVLNKIFKVVLPGDLYRYNEKIKIWEDMTKNEEYMKAVVDESEEIKISGIIRPKEDAVNTSIASGIGYTSALMEHLIEENNGTQIVKEQLADKDTDVFSGLSFEDAKTLTYESNSAILGITDADNPSGILIYAKNFEEKEQIEDIIKEYNDKAKQEEREADVINYTDYVGIMMSSVSTIITAISSVLIAFVAISLAVSSIMISIITYISVLERTKEIGILRSIGASKKDISRVFNAETLIEGFASGVLGIIITLILCIPANIIIENVTDIANVAKLPWVGAVILIIISMCLTMLAGFIPAKMAAKKDPVVALRTE